jgi:hypothetical protein
LGSPKLYGIQPGRHLNERHASPPVGQSTKFCPTAPSQAGHDKGRFMGKSLGGAAPVFFPVFSRDVRLRMYIQSSIFNP